MKSLQTKGANYDVERGKWLEATARRAGLVSAAAVAARVGVTRQAVADWFKGGPIRSQPTLDKLANVLHVAAGQILSGPYTEAQNLVNPALTHTKEGERSVVAAQLLRAVEHLVLTGNSERLQMLALWLTNLARDLERIDPSYDTLEIRRAADGVRKMIG